MLTWRTSIVRHESDSSGSGKSESRTFRDWVLEAVNDLIGALINGLWNSLTRHQKRTDPFRLVRVPVEASRSGLADYILMRLQEIDGFVDGLLNGQDEMDLPEKAVSSLNVISELRGILAGAHAFVTDESKAGSAEEYAKTLKHIQELTPVIEHEIHEIVLSCTRARRQMLQRSEFSGPMFH